MHILLLFLYLILNNFLARGVLFCSVDPRRLAVRSSQIQSILLKKKINKILFFFLSFFGHQLKFFVVLNENVLIFIFLLGLMWLQFSSRFCSCLDPQKYLISIETIGTSPY